MNTERSAPGNVVPTAVMPIETAVFAGIWDNALICDGVATTAVWPTATPAPLRGVARGIVIAADLLAGRDVERIVEREWGQAAILRVPKVV
jgi:hypothetical protein